MDTLIASPATPEELLEITEYHNTKRRYLNLVRQEFRGSSADIKLIESAYAYFSESFAGKRRDAGGSYMNGHLVPTGVLLLKYWGVRDAEEQVAMIGHDSLEDVSGLTENDLKEEFNSKIARRIQGLSKPPRNGLNKKSVAYCEAQISKLEAAGRTAVFMKCNCDRLHNMVTLYGAKNKKKWKVWETEQYFLPMAKRFDFECEELRMAIAFQRERFS